MQTDTAIEHEIQAKGLTAPRVTPDIIDALINRVSHVYFVHETSTFCHAFLDGTFYLCSGHSACVSKENFDHDLGRKIAYNNMLEPMRNKLWELEGYALRKILHQANTSPVEPLEPELPSHQQRVITEKTELDDKLSKLLAFFGSETYKALPGQDQHLLQQQSVSMEHYSEILDMRIEGFGIGGAQ